MENEEMLAAIKEMFAEERKITDAKIEATQKDTIQQVKALLENGVEKQIRLLAEGHAQILARLPDAEEQGEIKSRVTTLEHVAADHTRQLDELRKAQ
ncbi:hypothetical protein CAFE_25020 [Caprobacter fermentans]|uniref:Uncharacterized protein n=1 Tax=Caproicibacter fermentans TaxID=2576756 RepID=A0A6N8I203_9FIRM|nr:hypothetical protein [Caproicibacter fermentans]MVB11777.1 hypothetical protein [Caproicibacter fermentans]